MRTWMRRRGHNIESAVDSRSEKGYVSNEMRWESQRQNRLDWRDSLVSNSSFRLRRTYTLLDHIPNRYSH